MILDEGAGVDRVGRVLGDHNATGKQEAVKRHRLDTEAVD